MTQTLLTFYCIGATFAILPLAFALRNAWQRLDVCHELLESRKLRQRNDHEEICRLMGELDKVAKQPKPCEPPPGCVGATATSRAQREALRELDKRAGAARAPWRRYEEPGGGVYGYRIVGDGSPMPPVAITTGPPDYDPTLRRGDAHSELICEARNALPDLLGDVETLLGDVETLQVALAEKIAECNALRDAAERSVS